MFQHLPNETFAIAETGWNSDPVVLTGLPYPILLGPFIMVLMAFFIFLPCGIWHTCCFHKSKKDNIRNTAYRLLNIRGLEESTNPPARIWTKAVRCCCSPSNYHYNKARKICIGISFSLTGVFWLVGFALLYAPICFEAIASSEANATQYMQFVVEQAHVYQMPLVTWWSNR